MKSLLKFWAKPLLRFLPLTGLLIASFNSHASIQPGYNTAFYLNTSSYSTVEGGSISGTVYREGLYTGCSASCDYDPNAPATVQLLISNAGQTYPITPSDVTSNGIYNITIPANSSSASFTIGFVTDTNVDYDRTGTLNIGSGYVDNTKIQSASLTLLDHNQQEGVGILYGGVIYAGPGTSLQIIEGGTGGANSATISFFRNVAVTQGRTINYTLSGNAIVGTDYTPTFGTVTIAQGTNLTNVTITANNSSQTVNKTLTVQVTNGTYAFASGETNVTVTILADYPTVGVYAINPTMTQTESSSAFVFYRNAYYTNGGPKTVHYTYSGTAVNGSDFMPTLSGTVTIPGGVAAVTNVVTPTGYIFLTGTKTATVTLTSGNYQIDTNNPSATIGILQDVPVVNITAPTNTAFQNGNIGQIAVSRMGGVAFPLTVQLATSGTAVSGVNYTALPASVTFTGGQTNIGLAVTPTGSPALTSAVTLVVGLISSNIYFMGASTQAVVTLLPNSSSSNSVASPVGRYWRGSGSDPTYWSVVVPLDYEKGVVYSNSFGNAGTLYPGLSAWSGATFYHYNAASTLTQTNIANRIAFNNPIVAFGERTGGTPLYLGQQYNLGVYGGDLLPLQAAVAIEVYVRSNLSYAGTINLSPPNVGSTSSWNNYVTNGFQVTTNAFGLTTTLSDTPDLNWGATSPGAYVLSHTASNLATNYYYLIESFGYEDGPGTPTALASNTNAGPSLLYTLEFEARPLWRSVFIDQPHFSGSPLPPIYSGKTVAEILTNTPPVTNAVSLTPTACTNLDASPELRRHPVLDQFVSDMGNDPIALANYVLNQIDLTDPMDYSDNGNVSEQSINPGGVSRGALGTFMEKQGSPIEQCALLVYLLRQAGVPAAYVFPPHNGMKILDARLSQMLRFQVHGSYTEAGQLYTTNTMIPVNYPWVTAYISNNWVHIYPWLKDYEINEGLDLWEYMPTNYSSAYSWVHDYITGATNLLSLAQDGDNTLRVIFPKFLAQTLQQNYPGVSVGDLGVDIINRPHYYARWQDFPTPTWVTNVSMAIESLSASAITNVNPAFTNVFDTVNVEVYSVTDPTKDFQTGDMRLVDLHNRQFYLTQTNSSSNHVQLSLVLAPFRTNITTQASFGSTDTNLLSKEVLSMTLDQYDDELKVRFRYRRHKALTPAYPIDPTLTFLGFDSTRSIDMERPLRKGDLAAICMSYGRVTRDMLNVHATDLWQMENTLKANAALSNSISGDVYQGATIYLAGMSYYKKVSDFDQVNRNLHKIDVLSSWAAGLSKLGPARDGSGNLTNGTVNPVLPNVDMFFYELAFVGNGTLRPDSGETQELQGQNYNLIAIADGSAEEHQAINDFYKQTNAVSTVRLLQLAQSRGYGTVALNVNNYVAQGNTTYQGQQLKTFDTNLWQEIVAAFQNADSNYVTAYVTPGPMTNSAYKGMGALVLGWSKWQALITPDGLNGGFGENLPYNSITDPNTPNMDLGNGDNFTFTVQQPAPQTTLLADQVPTFNVQYDDNQIVNNNVGLTPYQLTQFGQEQTQLGVPPTGTPSQIYANAFQVGEQNGSLGSPNDGGSQWWQKMLDPVDSISGEFYVDETDLLLPGPIPLALRRNYSSQNLSDNQFGPGWKLSIMPYLSVSTGATNIYAADMDGAVLAYVQTTTNASVWIPTLSANPQLNNNTTAGVGGLANRLRDRIVQSINGGNTNYTLYGADGSVRAFQTMTFNNGILNQTRPYLLQWTDNRGNYYTFAFGTNSTQPDFGQVRRIQCSNGNYLGLYFDVYGHIIEAYSGDGRRLEYDYDDFGDLVTVTLPDATARSYVYQHGTQSLTNGASITQQPYSTHLIIEEDKPDGRSLQNAYDSQRRVTNQLSTAGVNLIPVRTGTFIFSNNFNITNSYTNTVTGYTLIIDGNNQTNRFDYTNNLITKITDPLGQTIQQSWYADNAISPGYPRSISLRIDRRGLTNAFQYDSLGNAVTNIRSGDLTGDGIHTQTATNTAVYNTNCLPLQMTDPASNGVVYVYDPGYAFLPRLITRYAGTNPISTTYRIYGGVTNVVTLGSVTQTNLAYGLPTRQIRAYSSWDAATNDTAFDGHGFPTQTIRYTGTTDPAATNTYFHNERGELVSQMDGLGAVALIDHDGMGRPTEQENFDEQGNPLSWSFNYYNDNGELNWVDGPRYNPEDYVFFDYDGDGRLATEIHWRSEAKTDGTGIEAPARYNLFAQTFYQHDVMGNLSLVVDPRGATTTNNWDALCRLAQRRHFDVDGVTLLSSETFGYEPGGQLRFHTNALGGVTETEYTTTGLPEYRSNADGSTNGWRYYLDGRLRREYHSNGAYWQTTYDDVNQITTRTFYSATNTALVSNSKQLDLRGNAIVRVDELGSYFNNEYDGLDRLILEQGPAVVTVSGTTNLPPPLGGFVTNVLQQSTSYSYGIAGRILTTVNALGETNVARSDALGRVTNNAVYSTSGSLLRQTGTSYSPDHQSVTVTAGTGTNAIVSTAYTDSDGRTLLSVGYPTNGVLDYTWRQYDLSGNLDYEEHDNSTSGSVVGWTATALAHDGLNRTTSKTDRDSAITYYYLDALGDVTNRVIPGGMQCRAAFNSAGQVVQDWVIGAGGAGMRTNTYTYFPAGDPFAGLLDSHNYNFDTECDYDYDDFLRISSTLHSATTRPSIEPTTTAWTYDPRGLVTSITEYERYLLPDDVIVRGYDLYSQLVSENISVTANQFDWSSAQTWDAAGRRSSLTMGPGYGFVYRADGLMTAVFTPQGGANYAYDAAGLMTNRNVGSRSTTITARDGMGRPLSINSTVNGGSQMNESLSYYGDGLVATDTLQRSDFTDNRSYSYANLSRRLTQEQLNLNATNTWTNTFAYDAGLGSGPGLLTRIGEGSAASPTNAWSGATDAFSRLGIETNTIVRRDAHGRLNGRATVTALLDGEPMPVTLNTTSDHNWTNRWNATMELTPGAHQLVLYAAHPSGLFTTNASVTFTNSAANERVSDTFDPAGQLTQRVWTSPSGATNRMQTLQWDLKGRLFYMGESDAQTNGYNWSAAYDSLGRRLSTWYEVITNGQTVTTTYFLSSFDPSVEFLELGISDGTYTTYEPGPTTWKLFGPDLNGRYGGLNGTGGLDGVIPPLGPVNPTISDARGNILGLVTNGSVAWNPARPTGYGAVPRYRPVPLDAGANLAQSSAWRGRWTDISGYVWLGGRYYNPESGSFLTSDPTWNERDPNYYTFCGGDPINGFDGNGRFSKKMYNTGGGAIEGFGEGYFGINFGPPANEDDYNGQQFGRDAAGALSTYLTIKGGVDTITGGGVMAASGAAEAVTAGVATPVAGPGFIEGAELTLQGLIESSLGTFGLINYNKLTPLDKPSGGGGNGDSGSGSNDDANGSGTRLRDPETGRFVSDPNNPPSPYEFTDAQRRAAWKELAQDPNSSLTDAERAQIEERGWRGPQRFNEQTGEWETMELSHEPIPLREGGTEVVPRWPDEHAAVDPHRQLGK
jgi:RHS repeat-associated protein